MVRSYRFRGSLSPLGLVLRVSALPFPQRVEGERVQRGRARQIGGLVPIRIGSREDPIQEKSGPVWNLGYGREK
jgi:hypothetical protein